MNYLILVKTILGLLNLVFIIFSVLKVVELFIALYRVWKNGEKYRHEVLELIEGNKNKKTINMDKFNSIQVEYKIQWPIIDRLVRDLIKKDQKRYTKWDKVGKFLIQNIYRQPVLVIFLSIPLFIFSHVLEPKSLSSTILLWINIGLVLTLIIFELSYFLSRRIVLGSADNLREDFETKPVQYLGKDVYTWTIDEIVYKLTFGLVVFLASSIIGFFSVYNGILALDSDSFVLCCDGKINCIIIKLMYFTLTTFATVGYGDIRPITLMAHFIVTLEVLFGIGCIIIFLFVLSNTINSND